MKTALLIVSLVVLCCATVYAGAPEVAFERIDLKHLPVCEVAPLLGPQFGYVKELCELDTDRGSLAPKEFPGVELITAPHPSARYLVAAGTAQGVAELRAFVERLDEPLPRVRITAEVYPTAPAEIAGWIELSAAAGLEARARSVPTEQKLRFPPLPHDYRPQEIMVLSYSGRAELMPLPVFANWPQLLLTVAAEAGERRKMLVGVGVLGEDTRPLSALKTAWALRNTLRVGPKEALVVVLERENSAVTVVLRAESVGG